MTDLFTQTALDPKFALANVLESLSEDTRALLDVHWSQNKDKGRIEQTGKSGHENHGMAPVPFSHGVVRESLRPEGKKVCGPCSRETALHVEAVVRGSQDSWDQLMAQLVRK